MAIDVKRNVKISGITCAVPEKIKKSESYSDIIGVDSVKKFINTVGISERHLADGKMTTSDLCFCAAENLFEKTGINRQDIDALIFLSQTPDYLAPATACILQYRLNLPESCLAYDVNLCCSGYVYGLYVAMSHLQSSELKKVLLLAGDTASYTVSPDDKGQMMLFGDAGTATILEYDEGATNCNFLLKTKGIGYKTLIIPSGGYRHFKGSHERKEQVDGVIRSDYDCAMNGPDVFQFAISEVPKLVKEFFNHFSKSEEDFDAVVFHQANQFIIKNIAKRAKIPWDKLAFSIGKYGNTGSATLPVTLCHYFNEEKVSLKDKQKILLCGFGIGLSLGIAEVEINPNVCYPITVAKDIFDDHIETIIFQK